MSMRVNQTGSQQINQTQGAELTRAQKLDRSSKAEKKDKAGTVSAGAAEAARPEISAKGKDFAKARAVAAGAPDVREGRVAELKEKIASGKYKVNADAIADRMVDEHLRTS